MNTQSTYVQNLHSTASLLCLRTERLSALFPKSSTLRRQLDKGGGGCDSCLGVLLCGGEGEGCPVWSGWGSHAPSSCSDLKDMRSWTRDLLVAFHLTRELCWLGTLHVTMGHGASVLAILMPWSNFVKWPQTRAKKSPLLREGCLISCREL